MSRLLVRAVFTFSRAFNRTHIISDQEKDQRRDYLSTTVIGTKFLDFYMYDEMIGDDNTICSTVLVASGFNDWKIEKRNALLGCPYM